MEVAIQIPKAFSVRDEQEFTAYKHLMARLNPQLRVRQVGIGRHVNGGCTVCWGMVYLEGQKIRKTEFDEALHEAGFDFQHSSTRLDSSCVGCDVSDFVESNGDR